MILAFYISPSVSTMGLAWAIRNAVSMLKNDDVSKCWWYTNGNGLGRLLSVARAIWLSGYPAIQAIWLYCVIPGITHGTSQTKNIFIMDTILNVMYTFQMDSSTTYRQQPTGIKSFRIHSRRTIYRYWLFLSCIFASSW